MVVLNSKNMCKHVANTNYKNSQLVNLNVDDDEIY
jgi:hypothetical protein